MNQRGSRSAIVFSCNSARMIQVTGGEVNVTLLPATGVKRLYISYSLGYILETDSEIQLVTPSPKTIRDDNPVEVTESVKISEAIITFSGSFSVEEEGVRVQNIIFSSGEVPSKVVIDYRVGYYVREGEVYQVKRGNPPLKIPFDGSLPTVEDLWLSGKNFFCLSSEGRVYQMRSKKLFPFRGLDRIKQIAGGEKHVLFLDYNGEIYGMGKNPHGQLGTVRQDIAFGIPFKIRKENLEARSIYTQKHTSYFLTYQGECYVFGQNNHSQRKGEVTRLRGSEGLIIDEIFPGFKLLLLLDSENRVYYYNPIQGHCQGYICRLIEGLDLEQLHNQAKSSAR